MSFKSLRVSPLVVLYYSNDVVQRHSSADAQGHLLEISVLAALYDSLFRPVLSDWQLA